VILTLLTLNEKLVDYALTVPCFVTMSKFEAINDLASRLPETETDIIEIIAKATLNTRMRVLQEKGRIEQLEYLKLFTKISDAAIISYYRTNFIS